MVSVGRPPNTAFLTLSSGLRLTWWRRLADRRTMVWNKQEYRRKYWAVRSLVRSHRSLVRLLQTARFACALRCAHWFAHFAHSLAHGKVNDWMSQNDLVLSHSAASSSLTTPQLAPPNAAAGNGSALSPSPSFTRKGRRIGRSFSENILSKFAKRKMGK